MRYACAAVCLGDVVMHSLSDLTCLGDFTCFHTTSKMVFDYKRHDTHAKRHIKPVKRSGSKRSPDVHHPCLDLVKGEHTKRT